MKELEMKTLEAGAFELSAFEPSEFKIDKQSERKFSRINWWGIVALVTIFGGSSILWYAIFQAVRLLTKH